MPWFGRDHVARCSLGLKPLRCRALSHRFEDLFVALGRSDVFIFCPSP